VLQFDEQLIRVEMPAAEDRPDVVLVHNKEIHQSTTSVGKLPTRSELKQRYTVSDSKGLWSANTPSGYDLQVLR